MNAAVTGGTGFFGKALLKLLTAEAHEVRALVRRPEVDDEIRALGALPVRGDLTVPGSCGDLVRPGDVVFHAAARVEMVGPWSEFQTTTVEGTRNLLAAALPRKPSRFVYVSSASVYSPAASGSWVRADRTPTEPARYNLYARAKLEAEGLVRAECTRAECPWTIVRLGFLYGPGNVAMVRHVLFLAERGRLILVGDGQNRIATCYVEDAARATLMAGAHPAGAGKTYDVASDEPVTQEAFVNATTDALGLPRPRRRIGRRLALAITRLTDVAARMVGRHPAVNRAMVALMAMDQCVDAGALRRELGWEPEYSFREGMRQTEAWYRQRQAELKPAATPEDGGFWRRQSA